MIRALALLAVLAGAFAAAGGFVYVDVNDPYVASLLVKSGMGAQNGVIVRVQKQVVAGFKYIITFDGINGGNCDVTLWDKLDGSVEVIDDLCSARPMKRAAVPICGPGMWGPEWEREWDRLNSIGIETPICDPEGLGDPDWIPYMPGGFKDLDVNDPYVASLLVKSGMGAQNGVIVRVQKQVVAGFKYIITFEGINGGNCDVTLWDKLDGSVE